MTSREIREKFLEFFSAKGGSASGGEKRGHKIMPSSSLLPKDDSSVLLTTAGMQQFKLYYTGEKDPIKDFGCRRTVSIQKSFRTSDIDSVGDETHLTFFEMLGNFSFGDYFKEDAIKWAWEFITGELKISPERCYVSVFEGDSDVPEDKESIAIWKSLGLSDDKIKKAGRDDNFWGPTGDEGPCGPTTEIYINGIEIWNIVFNEYYQYPDKTLKPLKQKGVDTGMGLERLAMVVQNKRTIFETDLFEPLIQAIPHSDVENETRAVRIIADHIRGSVFLISDGVLPSNIGAGYILRRLLRRAIRYGKVLGLEKNFLIPLAQKVMEMYKESYSELSIKREDILTVIQKEEEKFSKTLEEGIKVLKKIYNRAIGGIDPENLPKGMIISGNVIRINGAEIFHIYESYGLPPELSQEIMTGWGISFDEQTMKECEKAFKKHQELSRTASAGMFKGGLADASEETIKYHTAAHLMLAALRQVLGDQVSQKGSNITPERLRFDFSYNQKMAPEEIRQVEDLVNDKIKEDLPVKMEEMTLEEARTAGATGAFESKYGERVKVYSIDNFSKEICGGPHVKHTGEIGKFKIIKEESSSTDIRRIRATIE